MYEIKHAPSLIAKNTAIQIIGRILFLALSLINFKIIAVYLGPKLFGDYGNVFNYTAIFTVLADFGLFTVAVREIAKNPKRRQEILENSFTLRLCLALTASVLSVVVAYFIAWVAPNSGYPEILPAIYIGTANMFIFFISYILDVAFHVELKMQFIAIVELLGKATALAVAVTAIYLNLGFLWIVSAVAFGSIVSLIARVFLVRPYFKIRFGFDFKIWKWLLQMAIPLGVVFALNNLYFKVDSIMLYMMAGSYANGIYTAAYRILETVIFISAFFIAAMTPYLSNYLHNKLKQAKKLIAVGTEIMLATGLIITTAIIFYAKDIVLLLSGPEYLAAQAPLIYLAFVATLLYINSLMGQVLVLLDKRKILLTVSGLTLGLNLVLNYYLIPNFSYVGSAAATLISETLLIGSNVIILRYLGLLDLRFDRIFKILSNLFVAILLFFTAQYLNIHWVIGFFAVPIGYFLLLWKQRIIPFEKIIQKKISNVINV